MKHQYLNTTVFSDFGMVTFKRKCNTNFVEPNK